MSGPLARNTKRSSDWPVIESPLDFKIEHAWEGRPVFWPQAIENRTTIVLEKCHRRSALCEIVHWWQGNNVAAHIIWVEFGNIEL
jgi:hypothetical protein